VLITIRTDRLTTPEVKHVTLLIGLSG